MTDIQLAKKILKEEKLALCVVKDSEVYYKSYERGIYPLYIAVTTLTDKIKGASLADKVIGKAAAMLCKEAGIKTIYTHIISESAIELLNEFELSYDKSVPHILNREKDDFCPMEKLSNKSDNVEELIIRIEEFLKQNGRL